MNCLPIKNAEQTTVLVDSLCNPGKSIQIGALLAKTGEIICRIEPDLDHANLWRIQINRDRVADLLKAISFVKNVKVVED